LSPSQLQAFLESLSDQEALVLQYTWEFWARPDQLTPEGDWTTWLPLAGRGWGKTRVGAETTIKEVYEGRARRVALVAETAADARDVMIEGDSGILTCSPPWFKPLYEPSKRRLTWPNGAIATAYNAIEPEQLRGPQFDFAWCDELAKWRYAQDTWDNLQFGMRLGARPRQIVTTTPRPTEIVRKLAADPTTHLTKGRTLDNAANLASSFLRQVRLKYEGTRLGRQELEGEILNDYAGALWARALLDATRVKKAPFELVEVVVAVDPPVTSGEDADECGIIVAGRDAEDHVYIIEDLSCQGYSPEQWAARAVLAFHQHQASYIVAEVNQGGDMVESVIRQVDPGVSYKAVRATRGKYVRAEPVATAYEKERVHHVGEFAKLEDQMCLFTVDMVAFESSSPDRVDALVWAVTALLLDNGSWGTMNM